MDFFQCHFYILFITSTNFKEFSFVKGDLNTTFATVNDVLPSGFHASLNSNFESLVKSAAANRVKAKLKENPFQQWKYRSKWNKLSDLKLNSDLMSKAIQPGDPTRLRRVLMKALSGQNINLVVIGGSNSAGGKLGVDEGKLDGLFFKVFLNWWNDVIGKAVNKFMKEFEVAIGGTGSYLFAYCYKTFMPKDTDIDIALIEASINYNTRSKAEPLEQLTRQVFAEPSAPAVMYINLVSGIGLDPKTKAILNPSCMNLENFGQTELARHNSITSFSLKEVLCRKEGGGWKAVITDFAGSDGRHIGVKGHAQVAMMMIEYVRTVFNDMLNGVRIDAKQDIPASLPEPFFLKCESEILKKPLCWTGITPNIFQDIPHPTLQIEVIESQGFFPKGSMRRKQILEREVASDLRTDEQGGWGAWDAWSILKVRILVPPTESQSLSTRSVVIVTRTSGSGGRAMVWLDNNEDRAIYIDSKSVFGNNQLNTIATRIVPGDHVIIVKTVRWGLFLVSGILVGPPDFERRGVL